MNQNRMHTPLTNKAIKAIQRRMGRSVKVFKRTTGGAELAPGVAIRFGFTGGCDIYGYLQATPWPCPFEIEIKTGAGKMDVDQRLWRDECVRMGIPHLCMSCVTEEQIPLCANGCADWVEKLISNHLANTEKPHDP